MYRAITLLALDGHIPAEDADALKALAEASEITLEPGENGQRVLLNGQDQSEAIRTDRISKEVSAYSAVSEVRQVLVEKQRSYTQNGQGVVMDGRDIGTRSEERRVGKECRCGRISYQ